MLMNERRNESQTWSKSLSLPEGSSIVHIGPEKYYYSKRYNLFLISEEIFRQRYFQSLIKTCIVLFVRKFADFALRMTQLGKKRGKSTNFCAMDFLKEMDFRILYLTIVTLLSTAFIRLAVETNCILVASLARQGLVKTYVCCNCIP